MEGTFGLLTKTSGHSRYLALIWLTLTNKELSMDAICLKPDELTDLTITGGFTTGDGGSVADAPAHIACRCDTIIITERRRKRRLSRPERRAQERIRIIQDQRDRARAARGLEPQFVPDPGAFPGDLQ